MGIKAIRVQIVKPYMPDENVTWNELGQVLRDCRYMCSKAANHTISQLYAWEHFKNEYKKTHGEYPDKNEYKHMWYCYPTIRKTFPLLGAQMANQAEQYAASKWSNCKSKVLKLEQSLPTFKLNFPILVHNKNYSVKKASIDGKDQYIVNASLLSKEADRPAYTFIINSGDNSRRSTLERLIDGQYKQKAMQIVSDRKNKWYCLIPYDFEQVETELNQDKIMGLDLGITKAVYYAFSDNLKRGYIDGGEIEKHRNTVRKRRIEVQKQGKYCAEGRNGHGVQRKLLPVESLQVKERNFRDTTNHKYARHIVEIAAKSKCGIIQLEDLTGINEDNTFLKNWPYFDLQTKIEDKASEYGILVRKINPQYTSQRCSKCGHIERDNRETQETFICKACNYGNNYSCLSCHYEQDYSGACEQCGGNTKHITVNADYNAAKNIATPDIEQIIKNALS